MNTSLAWGLLIASGVADVAWAYATKRSAGYTDLPWTLASVACLALFVTLLAKALEVVPLSTGYAIWTGLGALGAFLVGVLLLGEALSPVRALFALVTLMGVAGLKLSSP